MGETCAYTSVTSVLGCATNSALKKRIRSRLLCTQLLTPWHLKELEDRWMGRFMKQWQEGFVMPGLLCCINGCTHMVSQGICIVENYLFITAYCSCGKKNAVRGFSNSLCARMSRALNAQEEMPSEGVPHASVVFVLDKSSGAYKKTVLLANHDHVGGDCVLPRGNAEIYCADPCIRERWRNAGALSAGRLFAGAGRGCGK